MTLRITDETAAISVVLDSGALQLMGDNAWKQSIGDGVITEDMILRAVGSVSSIIAAEKALEQALEKAILYHIDPFKTNAFYLEAYASGESAKRTLISNYSLLPIIDGKVSPLMPVAGTKYSLSLDHAPFYENTTGESESTTEVTAFGYVWKPTVSTIGTLPSRISQFKITPDSSIPGALGTVYVGIQPTYDSVANFVSRIDVSEGTRYNTTALVTGSGTSYFNDEYIHYNGAPPATLSKMFSVTLAQHGSTHENQYRGRFLVLARVANGGSGTVGIQMRHGSQRSGVGISGQPAYVHEMVYSTSGSLTWLELGEVSFPSIHPKSSGSYMEDDGIEIWIMTVAGSPTDFRIDALFLVPSAHMFKMENIGLNEVTSDYRAVRANTLPNNDQYGEQYYSNEPRIPVQTQFTDWHLPVESGAIVVVCTHQSGADLTVAHLVDLNMTTYGRWQIHRG